MEAEIERYLAVARANAPPLLEDGGLRMDIHKITLDHANRTKHYYTPLVRSGGHQETHGQIRGEGDLTDLLGKLMLHEYFSERLKVNHIDLHSGEGDVSDLSLKLANGRRLDWNIKTSTTSPYHTNLHLMVKADEIHKPVHGYIQCFVHHEDVVPHIHIAGFCATGIGSKCDTVWKKYLRRGLVELPKNDGGLGIKIPVHLLSPVESILPHLLDKR